MAFIEAMPWQYSTAFDVSQNIVGSLSSGRSHLWISRIYARLCQAINHQVISYASITQDAHHAFWLEAGQTLEDWFSEYLTIIC